MRLVDLSWGTGTLTTWLHGDLDADETLGVDRSEEMLTASPEHSAPGLRFERHDIDRFLEAETGGRGWDLVLSNAALHWLPDHAALWPRLAALVAPDGQLAVQMPANYDHVSHRTAHEVAREEPFAAALAGYVREDPVCEPEWYAELHALGFREPRVEVRVYPHLLPDAAAVIEWVRGSLLTDYQSRLDHSTFAAYLSRYRERLLPLLDETQPFFYRFKRLLMWSRLDA